MKCLACGKIIPDSFFVGESKTEQFKGGRFACPHCGAEHVRRLIGTLPSGGPLYTYRLWGHPASGKRIPPASPKAPERRKSSRPKRWR